MYRLRVGSSVRPKSFHKAACSQSRLSSHCRVHFGVSFDFLLRPGPTSKSFLPYAVCPNFGNQQPWLCHNLRAEATDNLLIKPPPSLRPRSGSSYYGSKISRCSLCMHLCFQSVCVQYTARQIYHRKKASPHDDYYDELEAYPQLDCWLRIVGLTDNGVKSIRDAFGSFDQLYQRTEDQIKGKLSLPSLSV